MGLTHAHVCIHAGVALEVNVNESEREARAHGNLVVAPDPGRPFVTALNMNDLCTPKMGALLLQVIKQEGSTSDGGSMSAFAAMLSVTFSFQS
jgi:hypothetical protein